MISRSLLCPGGSDGVFAPRWLGPADHEWIAALVREYERCVGEPRVDLDARLDDPDAFRVPHGRVRLAARVLDRTYRTTTVAEVAPPLARKELFVACADAPRSQHPAIVARVAARLEVRPDALLAALFADRPSERRVCATDATPNPEEIAVRANFLMVTRFLGCAARVQLRSRCGADRLARTAHVRGLCCTITDAPEGGSLLDISGPLALFRHTAVYGRALASLVPAARECGDFTLRADCAPGSDRSLVAIRVTSRDPVFPPGKPPAPRTRARARLARDLGRIAPDWRVAANPAPFRAAGGEVLACDLALVSPSGDRWFVDLAGWWTPDSVARRVALLATTGARFVVCVDVDQNCAREDLVLEHAVFRYRRRLDAAPLLERLGRGG